MTGACRGGEPVVHQVDEAALTALPAIVPTDGALVCTATGYDTCPLRSAVANRLGKGQIALWEPGRQVLLLGSATPHGRPFGTHGLNPGQYAVAAAVGLYDGGIAIIDAQRSKILRYKLDGSFDREDNLPFSSPRSAPGFAGSIPIRQRVESSADSAIAHLVVESLDLMPGQKRNVIFDAPIPWLRMRGDSAVSFTPLFPTVPVYAIDSREAIVWSPADSFWVQRRSFDGEVQWTLSGSRQALQVTPRDIELRRAEIERDVPDGGFRPGQIDSMTAYTPSTHPVVAGLLVDSRGRVLVAGALPPSRDSAEYLMLAETGAPTHRMMLPRLTRPLLFDGDSLLVHRPTEGEPWEVRWLRISLPATP